MAPSDPPPRLGFDWMHPGGDAGRLFFWLVVVFLGFAGFFYLFKVVYPESQRFTPMPHHVTLLNPDDPASHALLNRVQDRDFLLLPRSSEALPAVSLEDHAPVFHPSFADHVLTLQDLPHYVHTAPPSRLLDPSEPVLPPLDLSEMKPRPQPQATATLSTPRLVMHLSGELGERTLIGTNELPAIPLMDAAACRYHLSVDRKGRVIFALPLSASDNAEVNAAIIRWLDQLRFRPLEQAADDKPVWGVAHFQWRHLP